MFVLDKGQSGGCPVLAHGYSMLASFQVKAHRLTPDRHPEGDTHQYLPTGWDRTTLKTRERDGGGDLTRGDETRGERDRWKDRRYKERDRGRGEYKWRKRRAGGGDMIRAAG